jgi:hypothetical protein
MINEQASILDCSFLRARRAKSAMLSATGEIAQQDN